MHLTKPHLEVYPDRAALSRAAADIFVKQATTSIASRGRFSVALSGGSTPRELYILLADSTQPYHQQLDWQHMHFFWGDERCVPPDHQDSNYRMAHEAMLSKVPVVAEHIHRIPAEISDAVAAAKQYESTLKHYFGTGPGEVPQFDLMLLGLGPDGHTASLFPHTPALHEERCWVVANPVERLHTTRITLSMPIVLGARQIVFLVTGGEKAKVLREVLHGPYHPDEWPAQRYRNVSDRVLWLVDEAAARELPKPH